MLQYSTWKYVVAALVIAHIGDTYPNMFPALMMLAAAGFFLLHGAGKFSLDGMIGKGNASE